MITFRYKGAYIHDNFTDRIILVQIGMYTKRVQSVYAAKLLITKLERN